MTFQTSAFDDISNASLHFAASNNSGNFHNFFYLNIYVFLDILRNCEILFLVKDNSHDMPYFLRKFRTVLKSATLNMIGSCDKRFRNLSYT